VAGFIVRAEARTYLNRNSDNSNDNSNTNRNSNSNSNSNDNSNSNSRSPSGMTTRRATPTASFARFLNRF
jgi:hypothetical protein